MEQNFNNRGNGYGQNHNNVNNNQGGMNARPEVVNNAQSSGKSTFSKVAQHVNGNKTAYGVGIGVVALTAGLGFLAYKKGWIPGLKKKVKKDPAPAATAEPKPAQEAAGESK